MPKLVVRPGPHPDATLSLRDAMRRRKWVSLSTFLMVLGIGTAVAYGPRALYRTEARFLVDSLVLPQVDLTSLGTAGGGSRPAFIAQDPTRTASTQLSVLQSPEFSRRVRSVVRRSGTAGSQPPGPEPELRFRLDPRTGGFAAEALGYSPAELSVTATAAARVAVAESRRLVDESFARAQRYLEERKVQAVTDLNVAENALKRFKVRSAISDDPQARSLQVRDALQQQEQLRQAKAELSSVRAEIAGSAARVKEMPATLPRIKTRPNPEFVELQNRLAVLRAERAQQAGLLQSENPRLLRLDDQIASISEDMKKVTALIEERTDEPNPDREAVLKHLAVLESRRRALTARIEALAPSAGVTSTGVKALPPGEVDLSRLHWERDIASEGVRSALAQLRSLELKHRETASGSRLLQAAPVPVYPVYPQRIPILLFALGVGALAAVAVALLLERVDDRVRGFADVDVRLPSLGAIPALPRGGPVLIDDPDALQPYAESFRALQANVRYASFGAPLRSLAIASAESGEGKSVTGANLAISMALSGKNVILVDADLRSPSLHTLFNMELEPGLADVLAGEVELEDALRPTRVAGLRLLPAGFLPPNPPEFLASPAMTALLRSLRSDSDMVVLDTPPVLPVVDVERVVGQVDGVVLVARAGQTRRPAIRRARERVVDNGGRTLGVVMTRARPGTAKDVYRYQGEAELPSLPPNRNPGPSLEARASAPASSAARSGETLRLPARDSIDETVTSVPMPPPSWRRRPSSHRPESPRTGIHVPSAPGGSRARHSDSE
jgi:capsular exopolysaccharide synthesis family protein